MALKVLVCQSAQADVQEFNTFC